MGVTAVVAAVALSAGSTFVAANTAAHAKTDANTKAAQAQEQVDKQIQAANTQKQQDQDLKAGNTAAAQARVRAISNPDGNTLMTSPLGSVGSNTAPNGGAANLNAPPPTPGTQAVSGKTILGG